MVTLNQLKRTSKRPYRRVGRGQSSTRGKQSGRGGKGQTARAGAKLRPEWRDIIKKLPKRRGYGKNRGRSVVGSRQEALALTLGRLDMLFAAGGDVSPKTLAALGVINLRKRTPVKIVADGVLTKKLSIHGCSVSAAAKVAIEKAGGTISEK